MKKKIHLMLIIPSLGNGGSERVFSCLANEIDNNRFFVEVIIIDSSNIQYELSNQHLKIHKLRSTKVAKSLPAIISIIRKSQPNILFSTLTHLNILMAMIKPILGRNISLIGRESTIVSENIKNDIYPALLRFLVKRFYKNFDLIVCQSNDMMNDLIKNFGLHKSKLQIINNPISFSRPNLVEKKNSRFQMLTVGRIELVKGYDRILRCLKNLKFDFVYTIVGDGSLHGQIRALVDEYNLSSKVVFMGAVKDAVSYYQKADVYLHGSYYEGFPNVLLEAAANGIPIVAFNSPGGIDEIVIGNLNGILVDDHDDLAFGQAISRSRGIDFDRKEIQNDIFDRFAKEKIVKQYEEMFLKVLLDK